MSDEIAARMRKEMQWMGTDDCLTSLTKADLRALLDERDRLIHDLTRLRAPVEGEAGEVVDRLIEWPGGDGDTMSGHHVGDLMETAADLITRQSASLREAVETLGNIAKQHLHAEITDTDPDELDWLYAYEECVKEARAWLAKHGGASGKS